MKYTAKITVEGDAQNINSLFVPEEKEFQNKRASYSVETKGGKTEFTINAEDSTALRAALNSVAKNLAVYEKAKWTKQPKKK